MIIESEVHERTRSRRIQRSRRVTRQQGSATLWLLWTAFLLFLAATYSLALGQGFIARDQLQIIADSVARAAVGIVRDGGSPLQARAQTRTDIAQQISAIEPGIALLDGDLIFGDYDFDTATFTPQGDQYAPAVRVQARRDASFNGALRIAAGLFYREQNIELSATAIATFGCREVVIAIDASGGMEEEFDLALQVAADFKREMQDASRSGDKIGLTFYAAEAASLSEYAASGGAFWPGGDPGSLSQLSENGNLIDAGLAAFGFEGTCAGFRERLPGAGRGSCAGKGDHHGIDQALDLFDEMGIDACSVSKERLIILITSGTPCAVFGPAIGDFGTPFFGGTRIQAIAAANRAESLGVSIAPIRVDAGDPSSGDYCQGQPLAFKTPGMPNAYLNSLARGFVESALVSPTESDLEELIQQLNDNLTVRLVQ